MSYRLISKKNLEVLSWDLVALRVLQALLEEEFRSIILGSGRFTCLTGSS